MDSPKNHGFNRARTARLSALLFGLSGLTVFGSSFTGCASLAQRGESTDSASDRHGATAEKEPAQLLAEKEQKILELETSNHTLHAKIEELEAKLRAAESRGELKQTSSTHSTPRAGGEVLATMAASDPQAGMTVDASVQAYRQAKALFDSGKYPESILGFSSFVERTPNHTLAGLAQYYLAEAYSEQDEHALAEQEYYQVIAKYPHSPMVSFAYQKVGLSLRKQGKTQEAAAAEAQVEALFPRSPALLEVRKQQNAKITPVQSVPAAIPETAPDVSGHDQVPGENS